MVHLTRRRFLPGASVTAATLSLSGYATAYETGSALTLAKYAPRLPNWPEDLELTIAVIADIHACDPWMSEERVGDIVDLAKPRNRISRCCSTTTCARIGSFPDMCRPAPGPSNWPVSRRRSASTRFSAITTGGRRPFRLSRRI